MEYCPVCQKSFKDRRGLRAHEQVHQPKTQKNPDASWDTARDASQGVPQLETFNTPERIPAPAETPGKEDAFSFLPPEIMELAEKKIAATVEAKMAEAIPAVAAALEARLAQNLTSALNGAVEQINKKLDVSIAAIGQKIDSSVSTVAQKIATEAQSELEKRIGNLSAGKPSGNLGGGNSGGGLGGITLDNPLVQAVLGKFLSGGGSGIGDFTKQLKDMQELSNIMNAPMVTGMKLMSDMMSTAIRAGVSREDVAKAAEKSIDTMEKGTGIAKPSPGS